MTLKNKKILIFVADLYEDMELFVPKFRMIEEGAKVVVAGPKAKETYKGKHGYPCVSDISFDEVKAKAYDALIIPGGYAPDKLRAIPQVLNITQDFNKARKLIAFICHAGWVPISAKVLKGIQCTSYPGIKDDMINAGAKWSDKEVVIDKNFISSRNVGDIPVFCAAIVKTLS